MPVPSTPFSLNLTPIDGVKFGVAETGMKYKGRPDLMLATIDAGATVAGVFTQSGIRSAAVIDCEKKISNWGVNRKNQSGYAIIVNAGNANAFTGKEGFLAVHNIINKVANKLDLPAENVFSSSTGVIGEPLDVNKITDNIGTLVGSLSQFGIEQAARAIMTTDLHPKIATETFLDDDGNTICINGIAKGSGMIAPNMGTMLAYIFTNANIAQSLLQTMVRKLTNQTFNYITVDGDTSTSDTLLVVATGYIDQRITEITDIKIIQSFESALYKVMLSLAQQIVRDGEGAKKFIELHITGTKSKQDAKKVGLAIANSPLVKTAFAGNVPNWGRIVMAIGNSGVKIEEEKISISIGDTVVASQGKALVPHGPGLSSYIKRSDIVIKVNLGLGDISTKIWTCDLTRGYIDINAGYLS